MSAFRRLIGRELPCRLADLVPMRDGHAASLPPGVHEALKQGAWGAAAFHLRQAIQTHPRNVQARKTLAIVCGELGQHEQAAVLLDQVLAEAGDNPLPAERQALACASGLSLERAGMPARAATRYDLALESGADDGFALHRLCAIHLAAGDVAQAISRLHDILRRHPQDLAARVALGHLLQLDWRYAEAIWEYEQALCLQPETWDLPAYPHEGDDNPAAINHLEALIRHQPHFPDLRMRLGNLYSRFGDDQAAVAAYQEALLLHPEYLDCHIALARHEISMGRSDPARKHLRSALAINELNLDLYGGLVLASHRLHRRKQAADALKTADKLADNSALLMSQLELIQINMNSPAELTTPAVEHLLDRYIQTFEENPCSIDLLVRQAMLLRVLGRHAEARDLLQEALWLEPSCSQAWLYRALTPCESAPPSERETSLFFGIAPDYPSLRCQYGLALCFCSELEFSVTMEHFDAAGPESTRRILLELDELHLSGLQRAADLGAPSAAH